MKNLKTTIKLSVLALACLGAGALALQPTATAQAETEYADCIHMVNGASVCVKDDFSGIRWKSKVKPAQYRAMVEAAKAENPDAKITIGTLVMPTDKIGEDGELTEADIANGALDLTANINYDELATATEDVVFYTVVDFNAVADEDKQDAYAMELTAHSYIKIDDKYYFDNLGNYDVSRSARQVAWAAELDGDLDEMTTEKADKAAAYYNPNGTRHQITEENKNTGAAGTAFIDLNNGATPEQTVDVAFTLPENEVIKEVLIDTENVEFAYSEGVLTLKIAEGQKFPTGETYVAICTDKGFYTEHIIGATMVFDEFADFDMFAKIRENLDNLDGDGKSTADSKIAATMQGDNKASDYEFGGYYVLGKSLTWDATKDVKRTDTDSNMGNGWRGTKYFAATELGLTGTFNGLGRTIKGFQDGRQYTGLFQLVNGGTIKNTYFYNYTASGKGTQTFAHYLIDPKIENVFIYSKEKVSAKNTHYMFGNYLYQTEENAAKISNVLARVIYDDIGNSNIGGLFGNLAGITQDEYNWSNVYVASSVGVSCAKGTAAYAQLPAINDSGEETTEEIGFYLPKFVAYAENQKTANGYTHFAPSQNGSIEMTLIEGGMTITLTKDGATYNLYSKRGDPTKTTHTAPAAAACFKGVYAYYDIAALQAAKAEHNGYAAFLGETGGNCWKIDNGNLAFSSRK